MLFSLPGNMESDSESEVGAMSVGLSSKVIMFHWSFVSEDFNDLPCHTILNFATLVARPADPAVAQRTQKLPSFSAGKRRTPEQLRRLRSEDQTGQHGDVDRENSSQW